MVRFSTYPYWFFRFASAAFRSHSFRRPLALKYNTISRHVWQPLFFTFFFSFFVFDYLTSFLTAIYTFLDTEVAVASEVIFLYIIRYCSIQTSREVYTVVDITPRNANTFLAQFVKSFGPKFCSKILGSILAKPPKHKM